MKVDIASIRAEWESEVQQLYRTEFFRKLFSGELDLEHYKALLREIYYNTRENPKTYALFAAYLDPEHDAIFKRVLRHASAEFGHHHLALDDLQALGEDVSGIPEGMPLPTTEAFTAFSVYQILFRNPVGYLGYVYHLEMLPATAASQIGEGLVKMGVPSNAMSFVNEHTQVDPAHTQMMEKNFSEILITEADREALLFGLRCACRLHGIMLAGVLEEVDKHAYAIIDAR